LKPTPASQGISHPPRLMDEPRRGLVLDHRTFSIIERQITHRGAYRSVKELNAKILCFIDDRNERAHPSTWTKTADDILKKANRQTTSDTRH
jgi:hypothetical protein